MATLSNKSDVEKVRNGRFSLSRLTAYLPILQTAQNYPRDYATGDLIAGLIVAIMLIPQGMAYALLAGLPPQVGLYASMLPLLLYGFFGTSNYLAVGPVAIVSLMTAESIGAITTDPSQYLLLALTLALLVGFIQTLMGLFRIGFLVNFLSHPVLSGFTSAAAIVIGFSQVKNLLGFNVPRTDYFYQQVWYVVTHLTQTNLFSLGIGAGGIALLFYFKRTFATHLKQWGMPDAWLTPLTKSGPLVIVLLSTILTFAFGWHEVAQLSIVGDVPAGLPNLTLPTFDMDVWSLLLTTALAISFVGYMESISVAKSLASKRREKVDANQELIALGLANLGSAFTGGYPITGGFSRSLVNYSAGARTPLASIITASLIAASVIVFTPLFYYIPKATLAAIILVAVTGLLDWQTAKQVWRYSKRDAIALIVTFVSVLGIGIEMGILVGAATSLLLLMARTSNPHVAVMGRYPDSEHYCNADRHSVQTWPEVALVRVDASLYFANAAMLERTIYELIREQDEIKHVVLVATAVNDIDYSALETLEEIWQELKDAGVVLHLAAVKGPVLDRLKCCGFFEHLGKEHIHRSAHSAMQTLGYVA